jgi:ATP-dependent DNA helicase RecG
MNLNTPLDAALSTKPEYILALKEMGIWNIKDLLLHFPRTYEDISEYKSISFAKNGEKVTVKGRLHGIKIIPTKNKKIKLIKAMFYDNYGYEAEVSWFNQVFLLRTLKMDTDVILAGKVEYKYGKYLISSPKVETPKSTQIHTSSMVSVYPQHEVITSKWLREKINPLLHLTKEFKNLIPDEIREEEGLMNKSEAIKEIHSPTSPKKIQKAQDTLGYEELFLIQLNAVKTKEEWKESRTEDSPISKIPLNPEFVKAFFSSLLFTPTNAQKISIYEILKDMERPFPMMRLLEGDVGSGKTVVAVMSILQAVQNGYQTAIMAPTEVLARQHLISFAKMIGEFEHKYPSKKQINIQLLTGSLKAGEKKSVVDGINNGQVDIAIGTHALIQKNIEFKKLGLVVIDEQHRFGVQQREVLQKQGSPHILNMTATPIPRTLAIVAYGDQDLSVLNEMPPGRQEIITKVVPLNDREQVYRFVEDKIQKGQQMYIICPLIDESDTLELRSVKQEFENMKNRFPQFKIGLLHGKMKADEKNAVMQEFKDNKVNILVSTSVIEVGVDVPNSTMMIIEGADRFGLSQLHQFRGRVGRGEKQSYCFLYTDATSGTTVTRLKAMVDHTDGFKLAEIDMQMRGPGEVYGVRQSGIPDLKMANLMNGLLLNRVRKSAEKVIEDSPDLKKYPLLLEKVGELRRKMEK